MQRKLNINIFLWLKLWNNRLHPGKQSEKHFLLFWTLKRAQFQMKTLKFLFQVDLWATVHNVFVFQRGRCGFKLGWRKYCCIAFMKEYRTSHLYDEHAVAWRSLWIIWRVNIYIDFTFFANIPCPLSVYKTWIYFTVFTSDYKTDARSTQCE